MRLPSNSTKQAEQDRLDASRRHEKHWRRWGPYLSERAWGTVREDYSPYGTAWDSFPHDHARSRAYRWNEDGLVGICDNHQNLCFALALWNHQDPILKERLFEVDRQRGKSRRGRQRVLLLSRLHANALVHEVLYKYPQRVFPYSELVHENASRGRKQPEFELLDTGVFEDSRYFDALVEYAKFDIDDVAIRITVTNQGPEARELDVLPTLWFRNTWS